MLAKYLGYNGEEQGLIFLPMGNDEWFVGRIHCSSLEIRQEQLSVGARGETPFSIVGYTTIEIQATCTGEPNIQLGKPELVGDLSVNDLLRLVNRLLEERKQ